jgi:dihydrofolate synthase/folylpolyglutamate synthase
VGLEHTEHLGNTIRDIAREKGGIIKEGVDCFTNADDPEALSVLQQIASEKKAALTHVSESCISGNIIMDSYGVVFDLKTKQATYPQLSVGLPGEHQIGNAKSAVLASEYLANRKGLPIVREMIYQGLKEVSKYSGLRGRLELVSTDPLVLMDVAHNADGIRALKNALKIYEFEKLILVFGAMRDKDYARMIADLAPVADEVIAVQPQTGRSLDSEVVCNEFQRMGTECQNGGRVDVGVDHALNIARMNDLILITGSHFVVGEAIVFLEETGRIKQKT